MYLDSEAERREYVLTQQGFIYQGSVKFIKSVPWNFGQVGHEVPAPHGERRLACDWEPEWVAELPIPLLGMQGIHVAAGPERCTACLRSHS